MELPRTVVAIVDDDMGLLDSLGDLLRSAGYETHTYSSAARLLEEDGLFQIDCLVTDIGMPGMDGITLKQKANFRRPDLPIIFITARQDLSQHSDCVEQGKLGRFFVKPFASEDLLAAIAAAVERRD